MKIYSQNIKTLNFTSKDDQVPGKVEYSNDYFLKQEKETLKAHVEEHFLFDEFVDTIDTKHSKKPNNIIEILGKIKKSIKK